MKEEESQLGQGRGKERIILVNFLLSVLAVGVAVIVVDLAGCRLAKRNDCDPDAVSEAVAGAVTFVSALLVKPPNDQ